MNNTLKLIAALATTATMSNAALAENNLTHAPQTASQFMQTTQPMSALELGYAFELDSQHLQLASMNTQEMTETEGAALPLLALAGSSAVSSWAYHGISYLKTGHIGTSSGAAWAAGAGALGALHGSSLAIHTGLQGWQKIGMSVHGLGVSSSLNFVNPWR